MQEAQIEITQKKHDAEKQKALQDFDTFKLKTAEMSQRAAKEYLLKYESQESEINKMNLKFNEKLKLFEDLNSELKAKFLESKSSSSSGLDDMKKSYEEKNNELMRSNNEKYEKMMKEQLLIQGEWKML